MSHCPACGADIPITAEAGELCSDCGQAMDQPADSGSSVAPIFLKALAPPIQWSPLDQNRAALAVEKPAATPQEREAPPPPKPRYPITKALILANTVVFVSLGIAMLAWDLDQPVWALMNWGPFTLGGQWWRLLTSTFLHGGVGHLLGNMLGIWILGKRAEQLFGGRTYLLLYVSTSLAGSIATVISYPEVTTVGASGGIFGLSGALISAYGLRGLKLSPRARWKLAFLILYTAFSVYPSPGVNNVAHAAGLVAGLILGGMLSSDFGNTYERRKRLFARTALLLVFTCVFARDYNGYVVHLKPAFRAIKHGQSETALNAINEALRKNPKSLLANTMAAETYLKIGEYSKAGAAASRALEIDEDAGYDAYLLGLAKLHTGHCEEARHLAVHAFTTRKPYGLSFYHHVTYDEVRLLEDASCDRVGME